MPEKENEMKILYLINFAGKAGTEKYVKNLIEAYDRKKAECHFAYSIAGPLSEEMLEKNIPSLRLKMRFPLDLIAAKKLADYCRKNQIDVICPQYPRENAIAVLSRFFYKKPKVVFTSHLTISCNFVWRIINRMLTPHDHKVISVCTHGKKLLIGNGVKRNKIEVVLNAIETEGGKGESTIREELKLSDEFIISILARYHYSKGLDFLVKVIGELKRMTDIPFKLLIMGDGEERDNITGLIEKYGLENDILQLGYRIDTDNVLNGTDLYVNSSSSLEALSFAILEALAKGIPAVVTTAGGNTDIVNDETGCGIAVEYGDIKGMASAINKIMSAKELYDKMSANAIKTIKGKFNYNTMLDKTFECYK